MIVTTLIAETTLIPKLIVKQEKSELGYHKKARRVSINLYSNSSQDKSSVKVFFRENEKFFAEVMDEFWMGVGNDWA
jgi:hypothetical protein